jgi:hypothetical protein
VTYQVHSQEGTRSFTVSQRTSGMTWKTLGTFSFAAGSRGSVALIGDSGLSACADAVRFILVAGGRSSGVPPQTSAAAPSWEEDCEGGQGLFWVVSGCGPGVTPRSIALGDALVSPRTEGARPLPGDPSAAWVVHHIESRGPGELAARRAFRQGSSSASSPLGSEKVLFG